MSKLNNSIAFSLPQVSVPDAFQSATHGRPYVDFGIDNLYPQYLADLNSISPTHSAIIEAKTAFLNASLETDEDIDFKLDFDNLDGKGGNLEDFLNEVFTNMGTFDGAYVEMIYNKQKTRVVHMNVIPYEAVRVGKYTEEGIIDTVYVSEDWSRKYIKRNTPRPLAVYNPESVDTDSQVVILRTKKPNQPYYPIPGWVSAIQWIMLDDDVAEYSRNSILNGFTPSTIFNFHKGDPTDDDKSDMESYMKSKFTGKSNTKFLMFFDNDKDKSVDITTLDVPDLAKYWDSISPIITEKIFTGHKIYPSLIGVPVSNGLGSNKDELDMQFQIYLKTSILPLQKLVLGLFKRVSLFNTGEAETGMVFVNELLSSDKDEVVAEDNTEDNIVDVEKSDNDDDTKVIKKEKEDEDA